MIRTLVEAFVLVGIVVFLFLGKLRTTLIPLIAVPVSIIGAFAVMLAIGYSANTVSLLALVLAIGIVVDDAIVVIENVERVVEEDPDLSIPDATKKAMNEITAPIIAITLVLLSVFVPVAFIPGISGHLFRQFAVAVSVSMLISALNALTLSPALCSVLLKRGQTSRGPMRYVLGGIDHVRDGYAAIVQPAGARRDIGASSSSSASWRLRRCCSRDAAELPAGGGSGRFLRRHALAGGRLDQPHRRGRRAGRRASSGRSPGVEGVLSVVGFDFIDGLAASNQAFFVIRLKPYEQRTDPVAERRRHHRAAAPETGGDPAGDRLSLQPAADPRPRQHRRIPICAGGLAGPAAGRYRRDHARPAGRGEPAAGTRRRLQHLRRRYAADLSRHRPRQGAGARRHDRRHLQRAAIDASAASTSTTSTFRPHLAGQCPGRRAVSANRDRRHLRRLCAQRQRAPWCRCARSRSREIVQGPQVLVRYNGFRAAIINGAPKPGFSSGQALAAMERISATTLPAGYAYEWTGTALQEKAAGGGTSHRARPRAPVRLSLSRRPLRELEHPDPGAAFGQRRRPGRHRGGRDCRAAASTSIRRSAWWC